MQIHHRFYLPLIFVPFLLVVNTDNVMPCSLNISRVDVIKNTTSSRWKQKEIIITGWNVSEPTISTYSTIAREKYNLVMADSPEKLDEATVHGLRAIFGSKLLDPKSLHDPIEKQKLDKLIEKVRKYPALEAYFITDEPDASKFLSLAELVDYLRKNDPLRLSYINLLPIYASEKQLGVLVDQDSDLKEEYFSNLHAVGSHNQNVLRYLKYLSQFVNIVKPDIISYDHYHLFKGRNSPHYFLNLALISKMSKDLKLPFMNVIQAGRYDKEWRLPTAKEVRFQVYTTLAYGGRGISYFTYWGSESEEGLYRNGRPSPLAEDVAVINAEIHKLSPTLMSLEPQSVYHTKSLPVGTEAMKKNAPVKIVSDGDFIVGLFGKNKKTSAFMIVNRNYEERQYVDVKIDIIGEKIQELNRKTGKWIGIINLNSSRRIKFIIESGDGRLFRVI
jgi:hypothetical protein